MAFGNRCSLRKSLRCHCSGEIWSWRWKRRDKSIMGNAKTCCQHFWPRIKIVVRCKDTLERNQSATVDAKECGEQKSYHDCRGILPHLHLPRPSANSFLPCLCRLSCRLRRKTIDHIAVGPLLQVPVVYCLDLLTKLSLEVIPVACENSNVMKSSRNADPARRHHASVSLVAWCFVILMLAVPSMGIKRLDKAT